MDAQVLLRRAVEARIEAWDHPFSDERETAAAEVGLDAPRACARAATARGPGLRDPRRREGLSTHTIADQRLYILGAFYLLDAHGDRMLPLEADLSVAPGARSMVRVAGEESVFAMPTGERQFRRRMENVKWTHRLTFQLT